MIGAPYPIDDPALRDDRLIEALAARLGPALKRYFRFEIRGLENLPAGPALLVANHSGGMATPDSYTLGAALCEAYGIDAVPYGLAHQTAIRLPLINPILVKLGGVRACHENALKVFAMGRKVLVYPGGDLDVFRPWRHRDRIVFGGRRGYARLARRAQVPIVPVVSHGGHGIFRVLSDGQGLARALGLDRRLRSKVLPISLSLPWGLTVGPVFPLPLPVKITTVLLPPIHPGPAAADDPAAQDALGAAVEAAMQATLDRLSAER